MAASQTQPLPGLNPEQLLNLVSSLLESDSPTLPLPPPRRWDRLVRVAFERVFGPSPDPWRIAERALDPPPLPWLADGLSRVAINPQPLPPRYRFLSALALEAINRAELLQEVADVANAGEQRGIIVIGGYISRFADDFCGNGYTLHIPHLDPVPHPWFRQELNGADLLVIGAEFAKAARQAFDPHVSQALSGAARQFANVAASRLQAA